MLKSDQLSKILEIFPLQKHPEGGSFQETYRSEMDISFNGFLGERSVSTGIYFLLEENEFSAFHRIKSDEMWHFYEGGPLEIVEITPEGRIIQTSMGRDLSKGEVFQYVVKKGHWFASKPHSGSVFSFVGCTVSPGFDFRDFELAKRDELIRDYPMHSEFIRELTRN